MAASLTEPPDNVGEFAAQGAEFIERSVGVRPEFDSETLPLVDHYLRQATGAQREALDLVAAAAGTYFGEVVRRTLGGTWVVAPGTEPIDWRLVLPGGLSFAPAGFAAIAAARGDVDGYDSTFDAPPKMRAFIQELLESMPPVSETDYYSLCTRFDIIEHLQETMLAYAASQAELDTGPS